MGRAENRINSFKNSVCQLNASKNQCINNDKEVYFRYQSNPLIENETKLALSLGLNKKKKEK